ncbi:MAG: ankyrin repeat domain-containing protein [Spirochaetaceae bacterium]|nr:MAG: ankyrin repeat domain-containing protein [Spirochaetaceae bacterium]
MVDRHHIAIGETKNDGIWISHRSVDAINSTNGFISFHFSYPLTLFFRLTFFNDQAVGVLTSGDRFGVVEKSVQLKKISPSEIGKYAVRDVGIDIRDENDETSFMRAARENVVEKIRDLASDGANLDLRAGSWETTALYIAVEQGNIEAVMELIDLGCDIDSGRFGDSPLSAAMDQENIEIVEILLDSNANVNEIIKGLDQDTTPLLNAVYSGRYEMVRILLEAGAELDFETTYNTKVSILEEAEEIGAKEELIELLERYSSR